MKKITLLFLSIILVLSVTTESCTKEQPEVTDYREEFVGQYDFIFTSKHFSGLPPNATITYDTIEFVSTLSLFGDSSIAITFPSGEPDRVYQVSTSGVITKCGQTLGAISQTALQIEYDDNLCQQGPLGTVLLAKIVGIKQ